MFHKNLMGVCASALSQPRAGRGGHDWRPCAHDVRHARTGRGAAVHPYPPEPERGYSCECDGNCQPAVKSSSMRATACRSIHWVTRCVTSRRACSKSASSAGVRSGRIPCQSFHSAFILLPYSTNTSPIPTISSRCRSAAGPMGTRDYVHFMAPHVTRRRPTAWRNGSTAWCCASRPSTPR